MNPIIIDEETGARLWRPSDCAAYCGVKLSTWSSYTRTGSNLGVPAPVAMLDKRSPLWLASDIQTWHANRPGSPVPGAPKAKPSTAGS